MTAHAEAVTSTYEAWVVTLRRWTHDPRSSLHGLPQLEEASFGPATYARLLVHITSALETVATRWVGEVGAALGRPTGSHELSVELVRLRPGLARQLQLAGHPALPPSLREALLARTAETIRAYQREVERAVAEDTGRGRLDGGQRDALLRAVRECTMERLLTGGESGDWRPTTPVLPESRAPGGAGWLARSPGRVVGAPWGRTSGG